MSEIPEDLFAQLYRRAPTDADRDRLISVKAALGLSTRDEMWPVIITLDHYAAANQAARSATIKEIKSVIDTLKNVSQAAGPIAEREARKVIDTMIDDAADKIAKVAVKKSETRADRITKRQLVTALICGGLAGSALAATGAGLMYLYLDASGICSERPVTQDGVTFCVQERQAG